MDDSRQGIVHIIGPEQGFTLPGTTIVCGDSHTATHGAFGALAFGKKQILVSLIGHFKYRRFFSSVQVLEPAK